MSSLSIFSLLGLINGDMLFKRLPHSRVKYVTLAKAQGSICDLFANDWLFSRTVFVCLGLRTLVKVQTC